MCSDLYGCDNGITSYINDMKDVPRRDSQNIISWNADFAELRRLRHIRNRLAHEAGAFNENICTQGDINWLESFYARIINQTDSLSILHKEKEPKLVFDTTEQTARSRSRRAVKTKKEGCYIASCVYGSYDCPEVLTLRRYRDNTLANNWCGRMFIHIYYAISPILVKWFGSKHWFEKFWRSKLDNIVELINKT